MNVFYTNEDPVQAARDLCDKHIVKMVLESCQMLSTAHRVLDGIERKRIVSTIKWNKEKQIFERGKSKLKTFFDLPIPLNIQIYGTTHINHPSSIWVRQSKHHYIWLWNHCNEMCNEYHRRYKKIHKCEKVLEALRVLPQNIPMKVPFSQPPQAIAYEECHHDDSVIAYRKYYNRYKSRFAKWNYSKQPEWYKNEYVGNV